jgi:hypothetical protein
MKIDLSYDYLTQWNVLHTDHQTHIQALTELVQNPNLKAVSYVISQDVSDLERLNDTTYRATIQLDRNKGDLFTNFEILSDPSLQLSASLLITMQSVISPGAALTGNKKFPLYRETIVPIVGSMYVPIFISIDVESYEKPSYIQLQFISIVLEPKFRKEIMYSDITVGNIRYRDGMATPI